MRKMSLVLAALLAVAGICVMLWPVFTGHRLQSNAATAVQEFLADRDEPSSSTPNCWQTCKPIIGVSVTKSNPASLTSKPVRRPPLT